MWGYSASGIDHSLKKCSTITTYSKNNKKYTSQNMKPLFWGEKTLRECGPSALLLLIKISEEITQSSKFIQKYTSENLEVTFLGEKSPCGNAAQEFAFIDMSLYQMYINIILNIILIFILRLILHLIVYYI